MVQGVLHKSIVRVLAEGYKILDVVTVYVSHGNQTSARTLMHADAVTQHKSATSCIEKNISGICERTRAPADINHPENQVRQYIVIKRTPSHASRNAAVRHFELRAQLQFAGSIIGKYHRLSISSY